MEYIAVASNFSKVETGGIQVRKLPPVIAWDIDGTLVQSWKLYDEIFYRTSSKLFGHSFCLTKNPYGCFDQGFMRLTGPEVFRKRYMEVFTSEPTAQQQAIFFQTFDREVCSYVGAEHKPVSVSFLPNLEKFLKGIGPAYHVLVSSSTREFQRRVLAPIEKYFDWNNSYFVREANDKTAALEKVAQHYACQVSCLVFFGDAPGDMRAIKSAALPPLLPRLSVGVCFNPSCISPEELSEAGADMVAFDYSVKTLKQFSSHLVNCRSLVR